MIFRLPVAAAVLLASSAIAQNAPPSEGPITCAAPVAASDTAKSLMQRYGKDAVMQDLPGAEGETYKGLLLFPKSRDQRIAISFTEDKAKRVAGLTLREAGKASKWSVSGITIGSSVVDVQKANGKPFLVSGFEWDYGGFVTDFKGGVLGRPMQGGCRVTVRFGKDAGAPKSLLGDGVKVASDNATLLKWAPVVTEIGVNFPDK